MSGEFDLKVIEESEEQKKPIDFSDAWSAVDEKMSVRMSAATKKALEALAKKYKITVSEVIRQLVDQGLELVNRQK